MTEPGAARRLPRLQGMRPRAGRARRDRDGPERARLDEEAPGTAGGSGLAGALDRVGDRWSLLVVEALLGGPRRFGELERSVAGIAPNILADRLRRLERAAILVSSPYSRRPVRLEYRLTTDGRALANALRLLADWGGLRAEGAEPIRHALCGTALEARWHCPTCDRTIADDEAADIPTA